MNDRKIIKKKRADTLLRMAGNIASGLVGRYSTNDLLDDKKRQTRIAQVACNIARRIEQEMEG
jgi:hypothetical protein